MQTELVKGEFRGVPIIFLVKNENRGKRDGLTLMRPFLYKFNQRKSSPELAVLGPNRFAEFSGFLESLSIQNVDYVVGIDADTRFDDKCVSHLIRTMREGDRIVDVTGFIQPDPSDVSSFSSAYIYHNGEYMVGQCRRRLGQSLTSEKVTCLPRCCQQLCVQDSPCGDDIAGKFRYYPEETDGLFRTTRSTLSEADRKFWDTLMIPMCTQSLEDAVQVVVGVLLYYRAGPIISPMTQTHTLLKMDDFRWAKTQIAVAHTWAVR